MNSKVSLWDLTKISLKISFTAFGGGAATIPLVRKMVVDELGMLSSDTFDSMAIMCNVFPGPVITQLLSLIGFRARGYAGVIAILWPLIFLVPAMFVMTIIFFQKNIPVTILNKISIALIPTVIFLTTDYTIVILKTIRKQAKTRNDLLTVCMFTLFGILLVIKFPISTALIIYIATLIAYAFIMTKLQGKHI